MASSLPSNSWLLYPPFMSFEAPDRSQRCSSQPPPPPIDMQSPSQSKRWPLACRICGPPLHFVACELPPPPPPPLAPAPNPQPNSLQLAASGLSVARSLRTVCSSQPPSSCHRRVGLGDYRAWEHPFILPTIVNFRVNYRALFAGFYRILHYNTQNSTKIAKCFFKIVCTYF